MSLHLLPIQLEGSWLLIETRHVREVLGTEPWLPIPRARPELPGVVVWRGRAVPLVDLARVLGLGGAGARVRARMLVVQHERGVAALPIDAAREVRAIAEERLRVTDDAGVPYATREYDDGREVVPLVELEALLSDLDRRGSSREYAGA